MILINITRSLWHILDFSIFSDFVVFGLENLVSYLKDREFRAFFFFWVLQNITFDFSGSKRRY